MYRDDGEDDDDAAHPGWGVDERLLRFRAGPPAPREDPGAIRGRLPTFTGTVDDAPVGPQEVPGAQLPHRSAQPSITEMMADPIGTLSALPEHTQRLVLAQSMLSQQQILMGELARRRHWEQERWMHWQQLQAKQKTDQEERERARREEEEREERERQEAAKAARGRWKMFSKVKGATGVLKAKAEERKAADGRGSPPRFTSNGDDDDDDPHGVKSYVVPRRPDGLVDLRPEPPLPAVPELLSYNTDDGMDRSAFAAKKRAELDRLTGEEGVREAVLAAASLLDPATLARRGELRREAALRRYRRLDDDHEPGDGDENVSPADNYGDEYEGKRAIGGALDYARRLEEEAELAMREFKFVKAESVWRRLLAVEVGVAVGGIRSKAAAVLAASMPASLHRSAEVDEEADPVEAAPALYQLSRALRAQPGRRRDEEAILLRSLRALEQAGRADGANQQDVSDGDVRLTYRVLSALHAARVAIDAEVNDTYDDDDDGNVDFDDEAALVYAARALSLAERRHGPWHPTTADALCRIASSLVRAGQLHDAVERLQRALTISRRARGDTHGETGYILCALAQTHKRLGNFERASRLEAEWRRCAPRTRQPRPPTRMQPPAMLQPAGRGDVRSFREKVVDVPVPKAGVVDNEASNARPPPSRAGSDASDPLTGYFGGDLQEPRCGDGKVSRVGLVPALDLSMLPPLDFSDDEGD